MSKPTGNKTRPSAKATPLRTAQPARNNKTTTQPTLKPSQTMFSLEQALEDEAREQAEAEAKLQDGLMKNHAESGNSYLFGEDIIDLRALPGQPHQRPVVSAHVFARGMKAGRSSNAKKAARQRHIDEKIFLDKASQILKHKWTPGKHINISQLANHIHSRSQEPPVKFDALYRHLLNAAKRLKGR